MAQDLAPAEVPAEVVDLIRLGRLTALQKPTGGVCAHHHTAIYSCCEIGNSAFSVCPHHQRGGECIAHALQAITDLDASATIMSVDDQRFRFDVEASDAGRAPISLRRRVSVAVRDVRSMVRRGWSQFDVLTGWVQIVRGLRPKSQTWLRVNNQPTKPQVASKRRS